MLNFIVRSAGFAMIGSTFAYAPLPAVVIGFVGVTIVALTKNFFEE